jgi:hypothetical protein
MCCASMCLNLSLNLCHEKTAVCYVKKDFSICPNATEMIWNPNNSTGYFLIKYQTHFKIVRLFYMIFIQELRKTFLTSKAYSLPLHITRRLLNDLKPNLCGIGLNPYSPHRTSHTYHFIHVPFNQLCYAMFV